MSGETEMLETVAMESGGWVQVHRQAVIVTGIYPGSPVEEKRFSPHQRESLHKSCLPDLMDGIGIGYGTEYPRPLS